MLKGPHTKDTIDTNNTFYFLPNMVFLHVTFTLAKGPILFKTLLKVYGAIKLGAGTEGGLFGRSAFTSGFESQVKYPAPCSLTESAEIK